jgi:hypothetical protein
MFSQAMNTTTSPFDRSIALAFSRTPKRRPRLLPTFFISDGAAVSGVQRGPSEGQALTLGPRVQSVLSVEARWSMEGLYSRFEQTFAVPRRF